MCQKPNNSPENNKAQNLSHPTFIQDRDSDIQILEAIVALIDDLLNLRSKRDVRALLTDIGKRAKKISFNDDSADYIRNKYCSIDRSHNAKKREGGLELTNLEVLASYSGDVQDAQGYEKTIGLDQEFLKLKAKIAFIIQAEKNPESLSYPDMLIHLKDIGSLDIFKKFSGDFYVKKICNRLLEILANEHVPLLDFSLKSDRYYFGNILLKIGELSKELIDFIDDEKGSGIFKIFKKIRNSKMAHSPWLMVAGNDLEKGSSEIVRNDLLPIMANRIDEIMMRLDNAQDVKSPESLVVAGKISKLLFTEKFSEIDTKMLAAFNSKDVDEKRTDKSIKNAKDPRTLTFKNIEGLLRGISKQMQFLKPGKGLAKGIKKINNDVKKYNDIADSELAMDILDDSFDEEIFKDFQHKVESRLDALIRQSNDNSNGPKEDQISDDFREEEVVIEALQEVEGADSEELRRDIVGKLSGATKEVAYLKEIKDQEGLSEEKKENVMQFSLVKIVDILKNIQPLQIENFSSSMSHATIFHKSISHSTAMRNKGVAHDVFSFDKNAFLKVIKQSTITFESDIEALSKVINFNYEVNKDERNEIDIFQFNCAVALNNVSLHHQRLGNYDEAKKMLLEALEYFEDHNILKYIPNLSGLAISDLSVILEYDKDDPSLRKFNKDLKTRKANILKNLYGIYLHENDREKTFQTVNKIADLEYEIDGEISATSLSNQAVSLLQLGRFDEAQEKLDMSLNATQDMTSRIAILINQIDLLKQAKKFDFCRNRVMELENILNSGGLQEPEYIFKSFIHLGAYYLETVEDLNKAHEFLDESIKIFDENRGKMIDSMGNKILDFEADILTFKMNMLARQLSFSTLSQGFDLENNVKKCDVLDADESQKIENLFKEWGEFLKLSKNANFKVGEGGLLNFAAAFSNASQILINAKDFVQNPQQAFDYSYKALALQESCNAYSSVTLFNIGTMHHRLALNGNEPEDNRIKALEYFDKAIAHYQGDDWVQAICYLGIADIKDQMGLNNDAIEGYRKASDILNDIDKECDLLKEVEMSLSVSIRKEISERFSKRNSQKTDQGIGR